MFDLSGRGHPHRHSSRVQSHRVFRDGDGAGQLWSVELESPQLRLAPVKLLAPHVSMTLFGSEPFPFHIALAGVELTRRRDVVEFRSIDVPVQRDRVIAVVDQYRSVTGEDIVGV